MGTLEKILDKKQSFIHHKFDTAVKWSTKKIRCLFRLEDKIWYLGCKIFESTCSSSANYIGETKRNVETRWNDHKNPNKDSESPKDLRDFQLETTSHGTYKHVTRNCVRS